MSSTEADPKNEEAAGAKGASVKKLVNNPTNIVPEMLEGFCALYPSMQLYERNFVVGDHVLKMEDGSTALVSGGGSGHEPSHAGWIGQNMLSCAVAGDVFSSPSVHAVLDAINSIPDHLNVLLIVKNYTGDVLNFGLAAQFAKKNSKREVEVLVVGDDIALVNLGDNNKLSEVSGPGRRGLAGTVLIHKIIGGLAGSEKSYSASQLKAIGEEIGQSLATIGVGLTPCTVPSVGRPTFTLPEDQIELGLGIHGEAGIERIQMKTADEIVDIMMDRLIRFHNLKSGDNVVLLVNNLGGTPAMELMICARRALQQLDDIQVTIRRAYTGLFMTSLEMQGISLTLLKLSDGIIAADVIEAMLDLETTAPGWTSNQKSQSHVSMKTVAIKSVKSSSDSKSADSATARDWTGSAFHALALKAIEKACETLIANEDLLSRMDSDVGDGDLGASLRKGSESILHALQTNQIDLKHITPSSLMHAIALLLQDTGGSAGPLHAAMFLKVSNFLETVSEDDLMKAQTWTRCLKEAEAGLAEIGGAKPGDRTMLDALHAANEKMSTTSNTESQDVASQFAVACKEGLQEGVNATINLTPKKGRSTYLGKRAIGKADPGAEATRLWVSAICDVIFEHCGT